MLGTLAGCGAVQNGAKAVGDQIGRDTFNPPAATVDGISVHVYLDRSGSAKHLRPEISTQLMELLDLYPESLKSTAYWYAQDVSKIKTTYCSRPAMQEITEEYITDPHSEPPSSSGTMLNLALKDLQEQCARESTKQIIGVIVTDGGFEDDQHVLATEAQRLHDIPNMKMIVFVGLNAQGTTKLSTLDKVVRDSFTMGSTDKQYFDVTLTGGKPMLSQAKSAIFEMIKSAKESEKQ